MHWPAAPLEQVLLLVLVEPQVRAGAAGGDAAAPGAPGALGSRQPRAADSDAVRPPATPCGLRISGGSGRD